MRSLVIGSFLSKDNCRGEKKEKKKEKTSFTYIGVLNLVYHGGHQYSYFKITRIIETYRLYSVLHNNSRKRKEESEICKLNYFHLSAILKKKGIFFFSKI